ncbi:xanthine dehydrogenase family protein subunit M [bacterium]|nr:xanthine dehydrogenase family protein subunit M [bacterium]
MPIAHEFEYARPETIQEAIAILNEHGTGAKVLAGGTDVVAGLRDGLTTPGILVDIKGIAGLSGIEREGGILRIGALATFTDLIESELTKKHVPLLHEMAMTVASVGVRNRATITGNICSAVPSCDSGPVLLVLDASIHVAGPNGERTIPIAAWFTGPKTTALGSAEIVTSVSLSIPQEEHGAAYVKLGRYRGEDLAQASVAVLALPGSEYRVAFGAVAPTPVRAPKIEELLRGKVLGDALIEDAKKLVPDETAPIADIRASREYREHMLPIMFERGLRAAVARLEGDGPVYGAQLI